MRAALDTNLLVYAEGFGDGERVNATRELLRQLTDADLVVPLQCLGELFRVLTGKAGRSAAQRDVLPCQRRESRCAPSAPEGAASGRHRGRAIATRGRSYGKLDPW